MRRRSSTISSPPLHCRDMLHGLLFLACLSLPFQGIVADGHQDTPQEMMILESLSYYQNLRRNNVSASASGSSSASDHVSLLTREGNLDVMKIQSGSDATKSETKVKICHIVDVNRHSITNTGTQTQRALHATVALQRAAAVSLALEHLNSGNGRVVSQIQGLNQWCNIRFTSELLDTAGMERNAVSQVSSILSRKMGQESETAPGSRSDQEPCAFLGAWRSIVTSSVGLLTSAYGFPQISALSQSERLDDPEQFPLLGRMIPGTVHAASILVDLLRGPQFQVTHVAVVHTDDGHGSSFVAAFRETAQKCGIVVESVSFVDTSPDYVSTIKALKDTQYRFFVSVSANFHSVGLMLEAQKQGLAGNTSQHNWFVTGSMLRTINSSPRLQEVSQGVFGLVSSGSLPGVGRYDSLLQAWQELGNSTNDLEYLQSKLPFNDDIDGGLLSFESPTYSAQTFEDAGRGEIALFYDAAIALGLGACLAQNQTSNIQEAGKRHFQSTVQVNFDGASGTVRFGSDTGAREASSALYVVENYVVDPDSDSPGTLKAVRVHQYDEEWLSLQPVVFSDGTAQIPASLPPPKEDMNYIGTTLRAIGLTLVGVICCLSLVCVGWTYFHRKASIVVSSQPEFLLAICAGVFIAGCSIIPLSIDDEAHDEAGAGAACVAFPWLLAFGWATAIGSLLVKTRRVNLIFHSENFRRVTVKAKDVVLPMTILLGANIILLSVWTVLAMPVEDMWQRTTVDTDVFDRPSESHGECNWGNGQPALLISVVVINLLALALALQQAWVVRKLSLEYAESEWIARALCMMLIIVFVGLPLLIIANDDPGAFFFTLTAIIFVTCTSLLSFIFFPKMKFQYIREMEKKHQQNESHANDPGPARRSSFKHRFHQQRNSEIWRAQESSVADMGSGILVVDHPHMKDELLRKVENLETEMACLKTENEHLLEQLQRKNEESGMEEQNGSASAAEPHSSISSSTSNFGNDESGDDDTENTNVNVEDGSKMSERP